MDGRRVYDNSSGEVLSRSSVAADLQNLPSYEMEIPTMARNANTTRSGGAFDTTIINAVWAKATIVPGVDPSKRRKDANGAWIERDQYGKTTTNGTGWEVDHIRPVSKGGTDDLANLQPLQWQNNRSKADDYPNWSYVIYAAS